jgi:hypothetical protein
MMHCAIMYILISWLCEGTLMPGQPYLFEIVEESSFLLCFIQAFQMIAVTAVLEYN